MNNNLKMNIKKAWNWIWHSDSWLSWVVALLVIFIVVKFIFFPGLSLIFGTSLPLAGVESSSMDHNIVSDDYGRLTLCNGVYSEEQKKEFGFSTFDKYWSVCGNWYEDKEISKEEFSKFSLSNGFRKGDVIIVWGRFTPKVGDIIIFQASGSAPRPIIHRIVNIDENEIVQTKGDHNGQQLTPSNNAYNTDETNIKQDQIIGKAVFKIPWLGWPKIWLTDFIKVFR